MDIIPFKCAQCGRGFDPPYGGLCAFCEKPFCTSHLTRLPDETNICAQCQREREESVKIPIVEKSAKLVLLPGMDGTGRLFEPFINELGSNFEVSVVRLPMDEDQGYEYLTQFVKGQLPSRERVVLLAESFSGPIAYRLLQDTSSNITAAIFVASFIKPPSTLVKLAAELAPRFLFRKWILSEFAANLLLMGSGGTEELKQSFWEACKEAGAVTLKRRLKVVSSLGEPDGEIAVPCFYIRAKKDRFVPGKNYTEFQKRCGSIRLFEVDGPHLILQTRAKECAEIVGQIVERRNTV